MKVDIELRGWNEFQGKLRNAPNVINGVKQSILAKGSMIATRTSKKESPIDTGKLRSSITPRIGSNISKVGTNVKYAPHQEFGTRRGIRPKRFMQKGLEEVKNKINVLQREFRRIVNSLSF